LEFRGSFLIWYHVCTINSMSVSLSSVKQFEDIKGVIRIRISNSRRPENKYKRTNNDLLLVKLKWSLRKFYNRHHDLVDCYGISVSQMTTDMFHFS
jgi:hypothetical protein